MAKREVTTKPKRYFIVNPPGAIHEVTYTHAKHRLKQVGWRMAKTDEVKALNAAKGHQVAGKPLARPWSVEPEPEPEPMTAAERKQFEKESLEDSR